MLTCRVLNRKLFIPRSRTRSFCSSNKCFALSLKPIEFCKNQVRLTFPEGSLFRNWRLMFLLFILSIFAWERNREVEKVFYSFDEFEEWNKKHFHPFPYAEVRKKRPGFFNSIYYLIKFNYFSDVPLLLQLSATEKDQQKKIVRHRIWKIRSKMSDQEILKSGQDPNSLMMVHSKEHHSYKSFCSFLSALSQADDNYINNADWTIYRKKLASNIDSRCELDAGIELRLVYKSKLDRYYLLNFVKSIITS